MPVVSFKFDKILVERKKELEAPIKVNIDTKIVDIKQEDVPLAGGAKQLVLRFFYDYIVEYAPNQAEIKMQGNLVYYEPKAELDEVMKEWKKSKKISPKVTRAVLNNVLMRCQIKALVLAQDVNLPPHIRLPLLTASKKEDKAEYTG